jgi:serine/threonine protein phosphatase PrpC
MAGLAPGSTTATASIVCAGFTVCLAEGGGCSPAAAAAAATSSSSPSPLPPAPRWGAAWSCGRRAEFEDAFSVDLSLPPLSSAPGARASLFGVFDGHAGSEVATFVAKNIAKAVASSEAYARGDPEAALTQAFVSLDAQLEEPNIREELSRLRLAPGGELPSAAATADAAEAQRSATAGDELRAVALARAEGQGPAGQRAAAEASVAASDRAREGGGAQGSRRGGAYGVYDARSGRYLGPEAGSTALVALVISPPHSSGAAPAASQSPVVASEGDPYSSSPSSASFCRTVVAGSVGDSRALLGVPGAGGRALRCVSLSRDHNAQLPLERARVDAAGLRSTPDGRVATTSSSIAMTRSLGDARYKAAATLRGGLASSDIAVGGEETARRFAVRAGERAVAAGAGIAEAGVAAATARLDAQKAAGTKADQAVPRQLRALVPHPDIAVALVGGEDADSSAKRLDDQRRAQEAAPDAWRREQKDEAEAVVVAKAAAAAAAAAGQQRQAAGAATNPTTTTPAPPSPSKPLGPPTITSPFLLLACDGVFEAMPNDAAVALIARRLAAGGSPAQAAAALVDACLAGQGLAGVAAADETAAAACERCGRDTRSRDNITAVVVDLGGGCGEGEDDEGGDDEAAERFRQGA